MTNFPAVNNKEVSATPIQTSLQAILVLGRSLKIIANRTVIESRERRKSRDSNKTAGIGSMSPRYFVTAARSALSNSKTKSKNPMPSTIPKLRNRALRQAEVLERRTSDSATDIRIDDQFKYSNSRKLYLIFFHLTDRVRWTEIPLLSDNFFN